MASSNDKEQHHTHGVIQYNPPKHKQARYVSKEPLKGLRVLSGGAREKPVRCALENGQVGCKRGDFRDKLNSAANGQDPSQKIHTPLSQSFHHSFSDGIHVYSFLNH